MGHAWRFPLRVGFRYAGSSHRGARDLNPQLEQRRDRLVRGEPDDPQLLTAALDVEGEHGPITEQSARAA